MSQHPTLTSTLQPFVASGALAGAVAVVVDRQGIVDQAVVGHADRAGNRPMTADALFWIASMSKPLTAVALLMLVDEGKVALDDPVELHLTAFAGQSLQVVISGDHVLLRKPTRTMTVRHLLSHASGLPFMSRLEPGLIDTMPLREAVVSYAMTPLLSEPGTAYAYSNAGINTAGRIIEVLSGQPYEDFMRERLLAPLGMDETTFWPTAAQLARLATAYRPTADKRGLEAIPIGQFTYPLDGPGRHPAPAGGYFSTGADVARFARLLLNGGTLDGRRYLSPEAFAAMTTVQTAGLAQSDGLGCRIDPASGGFGHGGALATDLWIDPRSGRALVYLIQHNGYAGDPQPAILPAARAAAFAAV